MEDSKNVNRGWKLTKKKHIQKKHIQTKHIQKKHIQKKHKRKRGKWVFVPNAQWYISHEGVFRRSWDILVALVLIYVLLTLPLTIAFYPESESFTKIDLVIDIIFMIDIPLNCLTSYVNEDEEVISRIPMILFHYFMSGWLFLDVISTVPFHWFATGDSASLTKMGKGPRILKFLKMVRLTKLKRIYHRTRARFDIGNTAVAIIKSCTIIFTVAHWSGCLLFLIAQVEGFQENSWTSLYLKDTELGSVKDRAPESQYINSIYFAFALMTTIGFGDITPKSDAERGVVSFLMVFGAGTFLYGVTNMCTMATEMNETTSNLATLQDQMKDLLHKNDISQKVSRKIRNYILFAHYRSNMDMFDEFQNVKYLSPRIKTNVQYEFISNMFEKEGSIGESNLSFFEYFRESKRDFITAIAPHLKGELYAAGDEIILEKANSTHLYFLSLGTLEILTHLRRERSKSGKGFVINAQKVTIHAQCSFNEKACLHKKKHSMSVFATIKPAEVWKIETKTLIQILMKHFIDRHSKIYHNIYLRPPHQDYSDEKDGHQKEMSYSTLTLSRTTRVKVMNKATYKARESTLCERAEIQISDRKFYLLDRIVKEKRKKDKGEEDEEIEDNSEDEEDNSEDEEEKHVFWYDDCKDIWEMRESLERVHNKLSQLQQRLKYSKRIYSRILTELKKKKKMDIQDYTQQQKTI